MTISGFALLLYDYTLTVSTVLISIRFAENNLLPHRFGKRYATQTQMMRVSEDSDCQLDRAHLEGSQESYFLHLSRSKSP